MTKKQYYAQLISDLSTDIQILRRYTKNEKIGLDTRLALNDLRIALEQTIDKLWEVKP